MTPWFLLQAILTLMPSSPSAGCLHRRQQSIARQVEDAVRVYPTVSPVMLVAVGFRETHLGCVRGVGWGARIAPRDRGRPARAAARVLAWGLRLCGDHAAALRFFRTGRCIQTPVGDAYAAHTLRLQRRLADQDTAARVLHAHPSCAQPRRMDEARRR